MKPTLKPCPCGKVPDDLGITGEDRAKWSYASGTCCGEWHIEFRSDYLLSDDPELMLLAISAWNETPRGKP